MLRVWLWVIWAIEVINCGAFGWVISGVGVIIFSQSLWRAPIF